KNSKETDLPGRLQFDVYRYMRREHPKLRPCTLDAVCTHFLTNEKKEDVEVQIIGQLQRGSAEDRRRLAIYCMKVRCRQYVIQMRGVALTRLGLSILIFLKDSWIRQMLSCNISRSPASLGCPSIAFSFMVDLYWYFQDFSQRQTRQAIFSPP